MRFRRAAVLGLIVAGAFGAGFLTRYLLSGGETAERPWHSVTFVSVPSEDWKKNLSILQAGDAKGLRDHAGMRARVHGLVERVGRSEKSGTYFLNFGRSKSALTGVIFSAQARAFEKKGIDPRTYEGRTIEIAGQVRDDPVYGLEIFIDDPDQIQIR